MRRFYTKQHRFYCGIDLHARLLAICVVDHDTASVVCRTQICFRASPLPTSPALIGRPHDLRGES